MIDNKTQLNLVIGYPLLHSQSPILHNCAYHWLNCNAVMLAQPIQNLHALIQALQTLSVGLCAVTMPFKKDILGYCDHWSEEVKSLKAANTIINRSGKLYAYNTDLDGIAFALRNISLSNRNVLILGAGGASQALAYYLVKQQANLFWFNRTEANAQALIDLFGGKLLKTTDCHELKDFRFDLIVNTTPLGMFPHVENSPLTNYQFTHQQVIFDMVYNPRETLLIKQAQAQGAQCISGIDMFVGQGLKQIELWLEQTIDFNVIVDVVKPMLEIDQLKKIGGGK